MLQRLGTSKSRSKAQKLSIITDENIRVINQPLKRLLSVTRPQIIWMLLAKHSRLKAPLFNLMLTTIVHSREALNAIHTCKSLFPVPLLPLF